MPKRSPRALPAAECTLYIGCAHHTVAVLHAGPELWPCLRVPYSRNWPEQQAGQCEPGGRVPCAARVADFQLWGCFSIPSRIVPGHDEIPLVRAPSGTHFCSIPGYQQYTLTALRQILLFCACCSRGTTAPGG